MGTLRKYLLNGAIISSVLSGVSALRQGRKAPTDWRTYLTWIAWALTFIVALGTVRMDSLNPGGSASSAIGPKLGNPRDKKDQKKAQKKAQKAAKKQA